MRVKRDIYPGKDPMGVRSSARHASMMKDLSERFLDEKLPKLEGTTAKDQIKKMNGLLLPDRLSPKVADVLPADVDWLLINLAPGSSAFAC